MKKNRFFYAIASIVFLCAISLTSCTTDDPTPLTIVSAVAGTIDLNTAVAPTNVPIKPTIVITFATEVDPLTAIAANITLVRDYDKAVIPLTFAVVGKVLTITTTSEIGNGALCKLSINASLKATNGTLFTAADRAFTTTGTFVPAGQIAYWNFENNANDVVGAFDPATADVTDITYVAGRKTAAGTAGSFNGTTSIIDIPNGDLLLANKDFALSFWIKANSTKNGQFVMGLAAWYGFQFEIAGDWSWVKLATRYEQADGTTDAEDTWFPGNGETKDNTGWQGCTVNKDLTASGGVGVLFKDVWVNVICTYKASTKIGNMYINGTKMKEFDFNLWPADAAKKGIVGVKYGGNTTAKKMALGFIQARGTGLNVTDDWANPTITTNGHFLGLMDDVRIFKTALTSQEVTLMYNSEKP